MNRVLFLTMLLTLFALTAGAQVAPIELQPGEQISVSCAAAPPPVCPGDCGDGTCDADEDCTTCETDCGVCPPPPPSCGDGTCNGTETCSTCPADCGACPPPSSAVCANGVLEEGETCFTCWIDAQSTCPAAVCGNGLCQDGEGTASCPDDCPSPAGPPTVNLERWYRSDFAHVPAETGNVVHHFINLVPGDAAGAHAQGWSAAHQAEMLANGSARFSSTRLDSYSMNPEFREGPTGWSMAWMGTMRQASLGLMGSDGVTCTGDQTGIANIVVKWAYADNYYLRTRIGGSGYKTPGGAFLKLNQPLAFILTHERPGGLMRVWRYMGAGWEEMNPEPQVFLTGNPACWSCLGCYYPWWWEFFATVDQDFRETLLYNAPLDPAGAEFAQLQTYLAGRF